MMMDRLNRMNRKKRSTFQIIKALLRL